MKKAFVVLNPVAGQSDPEALEAVIAQVAGPNGWECRVHHTRENEDLKQVMQRAQADGYELFVAGGGDGTVSAVAGSLAGTGLPLAILPVGTGNVLARGMEIPTDPEEALVIAFGRHDLLHLDGLQSGDRFFLLNVSAGPIARTMRDVSAKEKRSLGFVAYLVKGVRRLARHNRHRFRISVDGQQHEVVASEAIVLNSPAVGSPNLALDPEVRIDDGRVELVLLRVKTLGDYVRLVWDAVLARDSDSPVFRRFVATEAVSIHAEPSLPVQGDGDAIGTTPIEIRVLPGAVRLAVPMRNGDGQQDKEE